MIDVAQSEPAKLRYQRDGAQLFAGAASAFLPQIEDALTALPRGEAGLRIYGIPKLRPLLGPRGPMGAVAASVIGEVCRPVRAILFNKSADANWSLGWHQDRTISVAERREVEGFRAWSMKSGMQHVEPPFSLVAGMVTMRLHLDDVPETNAPLLIAPGSHRFGRIPEPEIAAIVRKCGIAPCTAIAGDLWLYSTPILHASRAATVPRQRRVLQVDYASQELPGGLQWLGV